MAPAPRKVRATKDAGPSTSDREATSRASRLFDSYQNFAAKVGADTGNLQNYSTYGLDPVTRLRVLLEYMYRGSWICGMAIDIPAEDMTVEGVTFTGTELPQDIETLNTEQGNTAFWFGIENWLKWSGLYGGACAVMLIDGQDVSTPLNVDTIRKGQFKGFYTFDRWQMIPSYGNLIQALGPDLSYPEFYEPTGEAPLYRGKKIHYTRVLRGEGVRLPWLQRLAEAGWGLSVIERLYDRLQAFDSATTGSGQLIYKSYLRTLKIKNLQQIIAAGGPMLAALQNRIEMIRGFQTFEGLTLLDGNDDFMTHTYSFSGLDAILMQFGMQVSGALQIPLVRMFGQSPGGLNSSGELDLRTYYDGIGRRQNSQLRPGLTRAFNVLFRSALGRPPPTSFGFKFNPLWKVSHAEKAAIAQQDTSTILSALQEGLVNRKTALLELRQLSDVSGRWTNITDEDIADADELPPAPESEANRLIGMGGEKEGEAPEGNRAPKPDNFEGEKDAPG